MLVERIASELRLTERYVTALAKSASHNYKQYSIPKRRGGFRMIQHPSKALKAVQRWIGRNVLSDLPVHPAAMAYRTGSNIQANAEPHVTSKYLLRMDFLEFFSSIGLEDIRTYLHTNAALFDQWTPLDMNQFCSFVCRYGELPIGAPTSPMLSNALCYELDERLNLLATTHGATYTRYADDLFFSTRRPNVLRLIEEQVPLICGGLRCPRNLRINPDKTRHSSKIGARRVTGITLGSDQRIHLGRRVKRRIRAQIHKLEGLSHDQRLALEGWIAYAIGVEPDFMNSLIAKYGLARVRQAQGW